MPYPNRANQTIMKKHLNLLTATILSSTLLAAHAQYGPRGGMGAPSSLHRLRGDIAKLFGDNSAFSATLETHTTGGADGGEMTVPGRIAFLEGKFRIEMDMTKVQSSKVTPKVVAQMKQLGMDKEIMVGRTDKSVSYRIFPGLQSYIEDTVQDPDVAKPASDFKVEFTELSKESVEGHDCVKNKAVVTDNGGKSHEFTVWNASDLRKFPVKIVRGERGKLVTMLFKDVQLASPDASQFDPPADYNKYDSMRSMMQQETTKRAGAGRGFPPGQ
jgi:hypothetical protein